MKFKTITLASLVLACSAVFADSTTPMPKITIQQALTTAEQAGYTNIKKVELEHGQWEVKGHDAQGNKFEVKIDGTSGSLTKDD